MGCSSSCTILKPLVLRWNGYRYANSEPQRYYTSSTTFYSRPPLKRNSTPISRIFLACAIISGYRSFARILVRRTTITTDSISQEGLCYRSISLKSVAPCFINSACVEQLPFGSFTLSVAVLVHAWAAIETSVANNSPSQESNHLDDLFQSRYVTPGFKPFSYHHN